MSFRLNVSTFSASTLRDIAPSNGFVARTDCFAVYGDNGGGTWTGVTGASPGTYTHNGGTVIVPSGGDGSAAWIRQFDGPIFPTWFGATGNGVNGDEATNRTAILAAVAYAKSTGGNVCFGPGSFVLDELILLDELGGIEIFGVGHEDANDSYSHTTFVWTGDENEEAIFRITQSRDISLGNFQVKCDSSSPLALGISIYRDQTDTTTQKNVRIHHVKLDGNNGYLGQGFHVHKHASASDSNNSEHIIEHCKVSNYGDGNGLFALTFAYGHTHDQAKTITYRNVQWRPLGDGSAVAGQYGVYGHASFSLDHFQGAGCSVSDVYLTNPNDACGIYFGNLENSAAFLTTAGPSSSAGPITIESVRWAAGDLETPYRAVDVQFGGPVTIRGSRFVDESDASKPIYIRTGGTRRSDVTIENCLIGSSAWPLQYGNVTPRITFRNNERRPPSGGGTELWPDIIPSKYVEVDHWAAHVLIHPDSERRLQTGVYQIRDAVRGWLLQQSTGANQPALVQESVGSLPRSLSFDGSNSVFKVDTTSAPLALQNYHDGTKDWEMLIPLYVDSGSSTGRRLFSIGDAPAVNSGIYLSYKSSAELELTMYASTTRIGICAATSEVVTDQWQLARLIFTQSSNTLSLQVDDGTPITDTGISGYDSGAPANAITLGANAGTGGNFTGKIGLVFISHTIADATLKAEQERFYSAMYGISALEPS